MDLHQRMSADSWMNCNELPKKVPPDHQSFTDFAPPPYQQKWEDPSILDYGMRIEPNSPKFNPSCEASNVQDIEMNGASRIQNWDPRAMLNNLSFLEQKIHQLQDLVHLVVSRNGETTVRSDQLVAQQQQLITADLTSIIVQLISTAGSLLPSMKQNLSANPAFSEFGQLSEIIFPSGNGCTMPQNVGEKVKVDLTGSCKTEQHCSEEHEQKEEEDAEEGENLAPGSYEILQLEKEEILAPHTHFCVICGKGFKRDANLRMHMRGHGDEYKTAAALAKPNKEFSSEPLLIKRYSCPYSGCKRNKDHKKFQPLKTILCVKNHYKRTHCDKRYTCSRCNTKKFSVIADLKTHEKHCGRDKWLCSCGTTFSRKDKLFGHIALFQGHTPAIPIDETKGGSGAGPSKGESCETSSHNTTDFGGIAAFGSNFPKNVENDAGFFSPVNFDTCNMAGFHEFPRPTFEDSENSFSFLLSGSYNYGQKNGGEGGSNDME